MTRYVCIHGHYYQPPRENPWLGEVEVQDSAAPYHDWNERIAAECYGPCAQARIVDAQGRIVNMVNIYSRVSFNFGPTLLSWMERHAPGVYGAVIEADRLSRKRFGGHGSAVAQVYNHMIMPLASERDKRTQVAWGMEDFRRRFGRDPEGMWLPECAVDTASLEALAREGIRFVILAQRQAARSRRLGRSPGPWRAHDGDMDPTAACLVNLPSGRAITAFFHDGPISSDLAFTHLARDGQALYARLMGAFTDHGRDWPQLVSVAADGETFGHHHPGGDMALAWCLDRLEQDPAVRLTNYAQYLARHQAAFEVEVRENSSWSCVHGVERWRSDCGCNSGGRPGWTQAWRAPLREAVDWLGGQARDVLGRCGKGLFKDPGEALDGFISVMLDPSPGSARAFLERHGTGPLSPLETVTAFKLMEMGRMAQLGFTSCGWFFDEISGVEGVQILQYASRCVQLAEEVSGQAFEERLLAMLAKAPSNVLENGAQAYDRHVRPARAGLRHVAAHAAMAALFSEKPEEYALGSWRVGTRGLGVSRSAGAALACGRCRVESMTTRESQEFVFAALHLGGHQVICGVDREAGGEDVRGLRAKLSEAFERGDLAAALTALHTRFGENTHSLARLFKDEQRAVLAALTAPAVSAAVEAYRRVFEANLESLKFLSWLHSPLPREIVDAGRHAVQRDLEDIFAADRLDAPALRQATDAALRWGLELDRGRLAVLAGRWLARLAARFEARARDPVRIEELLEAVELCLPLKLDVNPWQAQNACFRAVAKTYPAMKARPEAQRWVAAFERLARVLKVSLPGSAGP